MSLPYSSHPIFTLRRALLITGVISIILSLVSALCDIYEPGLWIWHLVISLASLALCLSDLFTWAVAKAADPDNDPPWPLKKYMLGDIVLGVVFSLTYVVEFGVLARPWGYNSSPFPPYASITALASAILHVVCFWKALMRWKKAIWLAEVRRGGYQCIDCARGEIAGTSQTPPSNCRSRSTGGRDLEAGPPSAPETECLITPITEDRSCGGHGYQNQGYDAMGGDSFPEQILDGDAVVVKKKKKNGKDKMAGEKAGKAGPAPLDMKLQVEEYLKAASGSNTGDV